MPYIDCPLHQPPERVENASPLLFCLEVIEHMVAHCRTPMPTVPAEDLLKIDAAIDADLQARIRTVQQE